MRVRASACEEWVWQQQHLCLLSLGCHNPFNNKRFYLGLSTNKPRNNNRYLFCSGFHNRSIRPNRYRNCVWHKSIFVREMFWGDLRPGIRFQTKHQKFFQCLVVRCLDCLSLTIGQHFLRSQDRIPVRLSEVSASFPFLYLWTVFEVHSFP